VGLTQRESAWLTSVAAARIAAAYRAALEVELARPCPPVDLVEAAFARLLADLEISA
jgi:hypothetical protein